MSLVPILLNELLDDCKCPALRELHDQNFGLGLTDVLPHPPSLTHPHAYHHVPFKSGYLRPWRQCPVEDSGISSLTDNENEFTANLDVQQFKPEELKVTLDDGYLVVSAKHGEKLDQHGFISRGFTRRYKIPDDVDPEQLVSKLSSDGILSLHAPKAHKEGTREIAITRTNQPLRIHRHEKKAAHNGVAKQTK